MLLFRVAMRSQCDLMRTMYRPKLVMDGQQQMYAGHLSLGKSSILDLTCYFLSAVRSTIIG